MLLDATEIRSDWSEADIQRLLEVDTSQTTSSKLNLANTKKSPRE